MAGRYGSGRRHDPLRTKPTAESCVLKLDVVQLRREGLFETEGSGEIHISGHSLAYQLVLGDGPKLELAFTRADGDGETDTHQEVQLTKSRPPLRGERHWFLCPQCGRTVITLYLPSGGQELACNQCCGLTWASCQRHDKRVDSLRSNPQQVADILAGRVSVGMTEWLLAAKAVALGPLA